MGETVLACRVPCLRSKARVRPQVSSPALRDLHKESEKTNLESDLPSFCVADDAQRCLRPVTTGLRG